jgi:aryl-alcohol dehydrogenase-like predicted oxidoreductase
VRVSPLCLGCMNFGRVGADGAPVTDEAASIRIIHRAIDEGVNFLDTANVYTHGASETIVGKALKDGKRESVFLATKFFNRMGDGPNDWGGSRRHIMQAVEASLQRLDTDWIDLYQMHRPDPFTPVDETLRALDDLVMQGKVRYVGSSVYSGWQLAEAQWVSDVRNLVRFVSEQPPYSIFARGIEREVLPFCLKYDIAVVNWSPVARGWLTGRIRRDSPDAAAGTRMAETHEWVASPEGQNRLELVEQLMPLAEAKGVTLSQFAVAWCLTNPAITSPIIGPRTEEQLVDSLGALGVEIADDDTAAVDRIVPPGTMVPGQSPEVNTWNTYYAGRPSLTPIGPTPPPVPPVAPAAPLKS